MTNTERVGLWLGDDGLVGSPDPSNPYRYVGNNPTNFTDPSGLVGVPIHQVMSSVPEAMLWPGGGIYPPNMLELQRNPEWARGYYSAIGDSFIGTGVLLGGALAVSQAPALAGVVRGLFTRPIVTATGAASPQIRQVLERLEPAIQRLAGRDRQILERAELLARTVQLPQAQQRLEIFYQQVFHLGNATQSLISNGQVHRIGQCLGNDVYGSLISGVGICRIQGVTVVVRQIGEGAWEILGRIF